MIEIQVTRDQIQELCQKKFKVNFEKLNINLTRSVPGQWLKFINQSDSYIGFYSYLLDKNGCHQFRYCGRGNSVTSYIETKLIELINTKQRYWGDDNCGRLVHGESDGLPGVVIDKYLNCAIAKFDDIGFDEYREMIARFVSHHLKVEFFFQEDDKKRLNKGLPSFAHNKIDVDIETQENGISFIVKKDIIQKAGFYHDHKKNRRKMMDELVSSNVSLHRGIDLFSYVGGWGMHMLKGSVQSVDFVDQGDLSESIKSNLASNGFQDRGNYIRSDVFAHLESLSQTNKKYQVICCDPPAFAKSIQQIDSAKKGYAKLLELLMRIMDEECYLFFGSCTHYVNILDLSEIIQNQANRKMMQLQLLDIGTQAPDHTNSGLKDRSNYIKYLSYYCKRG